MQGSKPASLLYHTDQDASPEPASHTKLDAELEAHILTKGKIQALPQWLNARLEAHVSTTEEPYISVITALITGSITPT